MADALVLVVAAQADELAGTFRERNLAVKTAHDVERLDLAVAKIRPDVVVVDAPNPDDVPWPGLRPHGSRLPAVPVVVVSAASDPQRVIEALDAGAADYVSKPYHPGELCARVRRTLTHRLDDTAAPDTLRTGDVEIDLRDRKVTVRGEPVSLTTTEFDLLECLARHPGQVFSRSALHRLVWGHTMGNASTVTVHVRRLRSKIERDPGEPELVRTRWGVGYWLAAHDDPDAAVGVDVPAGSAGSGPSPHDLTAALSA